MKRVLALFLLLVSPVWGARDFNGTDDRETASTVEVTAAPLTLCCHFRSEDDTTAVHLINVTDTLTTVNLFTVSVRGDLAGDPIRIVHQDVLGSAVADTTSGFTINTWHTTCGVFAATNDIRAYIDGGSVGTETATTVTPAGIDATTIGALRRTTVTSFFNGRTAECGIWSAALTADEVASYGKGFSPRCIRPQSLVGYYPMERGGEPVLDRASATITNLSGGATGPDEVAHSRVRYCR